MRIIRLDASGHTETVVETAEAAIAEVERLMNVNNPALRGRYGLLGDETVVVDASSDVEVRAAQFLWDEAGRVPGRESTGAGSGGLVAASASDLVANARSPVWAALAGGLGRLDDRSGVAEIEDKVSRSSNVGRR